MNVYELNSIKSIKVPSNTVYGWSIFGGTKNKSGVALRTWESSWTDGGKIKPTSEISQAFWDGNDKLSIKSKILFNEEKILFQPVNGYVYQIPVMLNTSGRVKIGRTIDFKDEPENQYDGRTPPNPDNYEAGYDGRISYIQSSQKFQFSKKGKLYADIAGGKIFSNGTQVFSEKFLPTKLATYNDVSDRSLSPQELYNIEFQNYLKIKADYEDFGLISKDEFEEVKSYMLNIHPRKRNGEINLLTLDRPDVMKTYDNVQSTTTYNIEEPTPPNKSDNSEVPKDVSDNGVQGDN